MYFNTSDPAAPEYKAPECCTCEAAFCGIICASGTIDDWIYDDQNGI